MDKNGMLSAKYKGKEPISENGQKLMDAIDSKDVKVKMNAIKHEEGSNTDYMFGGTFGGNTVSGQDYEGSFVSHFANAEQIVNPYELKTMDDAYGKQGQSSLHEITEAYFGGKIAMREGMSSTGTGKNSYAYEEAHQMAIPQSGNIKIGTFSDSKGSWIEWQSVGLTPTRLFKFTDIK